MALNEAYLRKWEILNQGCMYMYYSTVHFQANQKDEKIAGKLCRLIDRVKALQIRITINQREYEDISAPIIVSDGDLERALINHGMPAELANCGSDFESLVSEIAKIKPICNMTNMVHLAPLLVRSHLPSYEPVVTVVAKEPVYDDFEELGDSYPILEESSTAAAQTSTAPPDTPEEYLKWVADHADTHQQLAIPALQVTLSRFTKWTWQETVRFIIKGFNDISVPSSNIDDDKELCPHCQTELVINTTTSEWYCDQEGCGYVIRVEGILFDDIQMHNQTGSSSGKHKNYVPSSHCEKRLNQMTADDDTKIPDELIKELNTMARKAYTVNNIVRDMRGMYCSEIRKWLKELNQTKPQLRATDYNDHVALIRKIVTEMNGQAAVPPRFSSDEKVRIIELFHAAMEVYEDLKASGQIAHELGFQQKKAKNKPFYQYVILKILLQLFDRDPRLPRWIQCIHLQRNNTLARCDDNWKKICEKDTRFKYAPTDPAYLRFMV